MDYKLIIILLILLFLIVLVYKEVYSFKDQINKTVGNVLFQLRDTNERALIKFQNNMNKCVGQIKGISNDNIQQLRKINTLNQQYVVRKNPNHFTEVENSETAAYRTELGNLSDVRAAKMENKHQSIFEKKENDGYYMSDDTKKSRESEELSEDAEKSSRILNQMKKKKLDELRKQENDKKNMICDGDKCYVPNKIKEDEVIIEDVSCKDEITTNIPLYNPVEKKEVLDESLPIYKPQNKSDENNLRNSLIESESSDDEIKEIDIESNFNEEDDESDDEKDDDTESDEPINKKVLEKSIIEEDDYMTDNSSKKKLSGSAFMKIIKDAENININENIYIDNSDTDADNIVMDNIIGSITGNITGGSLPGSINGSQTGSMAVNHQHTLGDSDDLPTEESFDAEQSSNKIDMSNSIKIFEDKKLPFDEQIKRAKMKVQDHEEKNDSKLKSNHSASKSKFSRMSKKSVISIVTTGDKPSLSIKTKRDDGPVVIKDYSLKEKQLKDMDDYTIVELKEIAKRHSVPTGYRERNKFKYYKKAELYENIKSYFENKSDEKDDQNDEENSEQDHKSEDGVNENNSVDQESHHLTEESNN